MDRNPQESYDPPGVGSIVPLRSQNASDISAELVQQVNQLLSNKGYMEDFQPLPFIGDKPVVSMKDYLNSYPSRLHDDRWIDSGKQVSAIHPETYLPFIFNWTGSKIIRECDGKKKLEDIWINFKMDWPSLPESELMADFMEFVLLMDELDLICLG
jgi:hypothetical protein